MKPENIKRQFLGPLTVSVIALLSVFLGGIYWLQKVTLEQAVLDKTRAVAELYTTEIRDDATRLKALLQLVADNRALQQAFKARSRDRLLALAQPIYRQFRSATPITHFYFTGPDRINFLRVHQPARHGDRIDRATTREAQEEQTTASGVELGPLGTYTLRVVRPWHDRQGTLLGYLELGEEIDHLIRKLHRIMGVDLVVLIDKKMMDRATYERGMKLVGRTGEWGRLARYLAIDETLGTLPRGISRYLATENDGAIDDLSTARRDYWLTALPMRDASGARVGKLLLLHDATEPLANARHTLLAVGVSGLTIAVGLLVLFYGLAGRTERELAHSRRKLLEGSEQKARMQSEHISALESERRHLEEVYTQLERNKEGLALAQRVARMGSWEWRADSAVLRCSDELCRLVGVEPEASPPDLNGLLSFVHPEDRRWVKRAADSVLRNGEGYDLEHRLVRPDETLRLVRTQAEAMRAADGGIIGIFGIVQDITERRHAQEVSHRLGRIFDESTNEIYVFRADDLTVVEMNKTARQKLGYAAADYPDLSAAALFSDLSRDRFTVLTAPLLSGTQDEVFTETTHRTRDGRHYPVELRLQYSPNELPPVFTAIALDITERLSHRQELEYQALHDTLTGLPNRALLMDRLEHEVAAAERTHESLALILIDIDQLKEVNDTLGHHTGDTVLRQFAERLCENLRASDTIARLSGDEFCALLPDTELPDIEPLVKELQAKMEHAYTTGEMSLNIETNIGIALFPDHGPDANGLIQHADVALHQAKLRKSGYAIYDLEQDPFSIRRLTLMGHLRHAIEREELLLYYQPKVMVGTGEAREVEALLRWHHPQFGFVSPGEFIPLAEQSGFIKKLTHWVLNEALRQLNAWERQGHRLSVSVNLSARNLHETDLMAHIEGLLDKWSIATDRLILEITESAIMLDPLHSIDLLRDLDRMGVRISIDDYGTGYSSLAYLKQLPADELKIDRSFITDVAEDDNIAIIARSTIDLAHNLGVEVTAEGVESADAWELLAVLGCDRIQGYYVTKPLPPDAFIDWLSANAGSSAARQAAGTRKT